MSYFDLKLIYDGLRIKLYKFEEPKNVFPTLDLSHKNRSYEDRPLLTAELKALGYSWWIVGRSNLPPTHVLHTNDCLYDKSYIRHKSAKPPQDILFVDIETEEYEVCSKVLIKVPQIPKVFCISTGHWLVHNSLIYRPDKSVKRTLILYLKPEELRKLEDAGLSDLEIYRHLPDVFICYTQSVPTSLWLNLDEVKNKVIAESNLLTNLMEETMPLYIDGEGTKGYVYYKDDHNTYWRCKNRELSPDQASKLLGLNCHVVVTATSDRYYSSELTIPPSVLDLKPSDKIYLTLRRGNTLELVVTNYYNKDSKDQYCNYKQLRFKQAFVLPEKLCFINGKEDLEAESIVKIQANVSASEDKKFRVCYVNDHRIKFLSGIYAFAKDTTKQSRQKTNHKEIENQFQQLNLKHELPGGWRYWSLEDLEEYDRLMRTGEYSDDTIIKVGQRSIKIMSELPSRYWDFKTFTSKTSNRKTTVWKKQEWSELVGKVRKEFERDGVKLDKEEISRIMTYAAALSGNLTSMLDTYARLMGLTEMERLTLLSQTDGNKQNYERNDDSSQPQLDLQHTDTILKHG